MTRQASAILLISAVMVFSGAASLAAQEYPDIRIFDYKHGACLVDGKEIRPLIRLEGGFYDVGLPPEGYNQTTLENRLEYQMSSCLEYLDRAENSACVQAVRHTLSNTEREYPECVRRFRSWVPQCQAHYRGQRPKCDANMRRYAQVSETRRNEESDFLYFEQDDLEPQQLYRMLRSWGVDLEPICKQAEENHAAKLADYRRYLAEYGNRGSGVFKSIERDAAEFVEACRDALTAPR